MFIVRVMLIIFGIVSYEYFEVTGVTTIIIGIILLVLFFLENFILTGILFSLDPV